jgi:hypothetical protein
MLRNLLRIRSTIDILVNLDGEQNKTHQDRFDIPLEEPINLCVGRAVANLSWSVLSKSFASNEKTATQLISNRILDFNVSLIIFFLKT